MVYLAIKELANIAEDVIIVTSRLVIRRYLQFMYRKATVIQLNPLTPMSDQDRISPYNINTTSSRQVMSIPKNLNLGIISWSNAKCWTNIMRIV